MSEQSGPDRTGAASTAADSTPADSTPADSTAADSTAADSTAADSTAADSTTGDSIGHGTGPVVVAIDGPAGSGKSSVSRAAARTLGYAYQDTGAAYRALAWSALDRGIETADAAAVIEALDGFDYRLGTDPEHAAVHVGETDITAAIRETRVTNVVSDIAQIPEVRAFLVDLFRRVIRDTDRPGIITEGRDITTVVAPDGDVRILLTASETARMGRRAAETAGQSAEITSQQLSARDQRDSRVVDFMKAADGVTTVDSTDLDFTQTVHAVVDLIRATSTRSDG